MARLLYFSFYPDELTDGISRKIKEQTKALTLLNNEVHIGRPKIGKDYIEYFIDNQKIATFRTDFIGKIEYYYCLFKELYSIIQSKDIEAVYFRYNLACNHSMINFLRKLHDSKIAIAIEIPTYPYDGEQRCNSIVTTLKTLSDYWYRTKLHKYIDYIVTFSNDAKIWDCPTIAISNAVNPNLIKIWEMPKMNDTFSMIGVANLADWHGFDRIIRGISDYNKRCGEYKIEFHIVGGDSTNSTVMKLKKLTTELGLIQNIIFHGKLSGTELNNVFDSSHIAIGSLGRHRNGIKSMKSLKNIEYATRGIPFIYSEDNSDFDSKPYVLKFNKDDSPIDIKSIIRFSQSIEYNPMSIRKSVSNLTWIKQMSVISKRLNDIVLRKKK